MPPSPRKKKPAPKSPRPAGHGGKPRSRAGGVSPRSPRRAASPASAAAPSSQSGERLQKVLAAAGIASRRECEILITEGRVEVDGQVVSELGVRVDPAKQEIRLDGEPLRRTRKVYYAINKPRGVVSTLRDPAGRTRVIDLLPLDAGRVFNVGRLDMESEGLILATNDGELANKLTHPRHGVEKIYHVQVAGIVEKDVLEQLRQGAYLAEGYVRPVDVRTKAHVKKSTVLEMVLDEGRNREIRRLLAKVGHKVQKLVRIAVGPVRLGEMPVGSVRALSREELAKLQKAADEGGSGDARPPRRAGTAKPTRPRSTGSGRSTTGQKSKSRKSDMKTLDAPSRAVIGAVDAPPETPAKKQATPPRSAPRSAKSSGTPGGKFPKKPTERFVGGKGKSGKGPVKPGGGKGGGYPGKRGGAPGKGNR
ncbi:MAG: rRNA pseudouridine synthase [Pirellulales bacterium]|nr:rRNA pseudouridine synthase [Pirellulales bacterium]